jgi:hypothetical protein
MDTSKTTDFFSLLKEKRELELNFSQLMIIVRSTAEKRIGA